MKKRYVLLLLLLTLSLLYACSDALDYNDIGLKHYENHTYTEAIKAYTQAIELDPKLEAAYSNRGMARIEISAFKEAVQDFTKALELNPDDAYSYMNRGKAYAGMGEKQKALSDWEKAIQLKTALKQRLQSEIETLQSK